MAAPHSAQRRIDRVVLIVLDSVGCGAAPDAADYGDADADTLANLSFAVGGVTLPHLQGLGLGWRGLAVEHGVHQQLQFSGVHGVLRSRARLRAPRRPAARAGAAAPRTGAT